MTIYPIPEALASTSDGPEWAIAAVLEGRAVAVLYLSDIAPELLEYVDTPSAEFVLRQWARNAPKDFQQLARLGSVGVGTVHAGSFQQYWQLPYQA